MCKWACGVLLHACCVQAGGQALHFSLILPPTTAALQGAALWMAAPRLAAGIVSAPCSTASLPQQTSLCWRAVRLGPSSSVVLHRIPLLLLVVHSKHRSVMHRTLW